MKELSLTEMSIELLTINEDFTHYCMDSSSKVSDFKLYTFEQIWGNTSGGFGEIGGSAMTNQRAYVFIPYDTEKEHCLVYFGPSFAYAVPYSQTFIDDVKESNIASKPKHMKYL